MANIETVLLFQETGEYFQVVIFFPLRWDGDTSEVPG